MNRRTSVYTLRLQTAAEVSAVAAALTVPINDHGDRAVSWRAATDAEATETATAALSAAGVRAATLTTGLGVHRRTVAEQTEPEEETTESCSTATRADADALAARINAAQAAGRTVLVNGREVFSPYTRNQVAQVWGTGSVSVSVRQRTNPARSTDAWIKAGQPVELTIA